MEGPKTEEVDSQNELRILCMGTDGVLRLKDKRGVEHVLSPLDMADMVEFETKMSGSVVDIDKVNVKLSHILFLLYLSLRKETMSEEDIYKRNFKWNERQVYMMFDLKALAKAPEIFFDLLKISGLEFKRPTKAPTVPSETAGNQS